MTVDQILMRSDCTTCSTSTGYVATKNGQDCVYCCGCGGWQYNRPRTESGREVRSIRSNAEVAPSQRARVLARDNYTCMCGKGDDLHVDHAIPLAVAAELDFVDELIRSDDNLVTLCVECNIGKSVTLWEARMLYRILVLRRKQRNA